ncbi:hypothetical protein FOL47_000302 [Perkinsus chesapeaki]|uniref:DNA helicase n=1 Tax=Perkinsus chesapeaki TaxID=330153 RepID=A0A7J6MM84_PERCH|nr:hypothetical protein FOL47_000302 [Perkinsus chesapeaki]
MLGLSRRALGPALVRPLYQRGLMAASTTAFRTTAPTMWSSGVRGFASMPPVKPNNSLVPVNDTVSTTGLLPACKSKIAEVTNKSAIFEISVGVVVAQYKQIFLSLMRNIFQSFRPLLITVIMGNMLKMAAFLMQFPISFYSIFFFEVFYGMAQLAISFVFVCFFHNNMSLQTRMAAFLLQIPVGFYSIFMFEVFYGIFQLGLSFVFVCFFHNDVSMQSRARQQLLRTMRRNLRRFKHMMPLTVDAFVDLQRELLPLERDEEISQTTEVLQTRSNAELQDRGVVILKLLLDSVSTGPYGRPLLTFTKPSGRGEQRPLLPPNRFTSGDIVGVFSVSGHQGFSGEPEVSGVVHSVGQTSVVVVADDPELDTDNLKVGGGAPAYSLALMGSDVTYKRLNSVLDRLAKSVHNPIVSCCFGETSIPSLHPRVQDDIPLTYGANLNEVQRRAVRVCLDASPLALVHGPPGTGKTTVLVSYILESIKIHQKLLVCAPSNVAVDNLLERVTSVGGISNVVRIGHPARVGQGLEKYTLDAKLARSDQQQLVGDIRGEIDKCMKERLKAREKGTRRRLQGEVRELRKELKYISPEVSTGLWKYGMPYRISIIQYTGSRERRAVSEVIGQSSVVFATCTAAGGRALARALEDVYSEGSARLFDVVVIDEAAQAIEAACWIPLLMGKKAVLAGDHKQLAATVLSEEAAKKGLQVTLFGRLMEMMEDASKEEGREMPSVMLTTQYRMNQSIMGWSNSQFYSGHLIADDSVKSRTLAELTQKVLPPATIESLGPWVDDDLLSRPLLWIDTAGVDWMHEDEVGEEESRSNSSEATIVVKYIEYLRASGIGKNQTAVISPYNRQVGMIREALKNSFNEVDASFVSTVDSYQGQEQEVVVLSLVRSNDEGEVGFLKDYRRLNVAVTRAKRQLVIVGDSETIGADEVLATLYSYASDSGFIIPALSVVADVSELSNYLAAKSAKNHQAVSKVPARQVEAQTCERIPEIPQARADLSLEEVDAILDSLAPDETHSFDSSLSAASRRLVHERSELRGFKHGSSGDGAMRYVWVRAASGPGEDSGSEASAQAPKVVHDEEPAASFSTKSKTQKRADARIRPKPKKHAKAEPLTRKDKPANICAYADCPSVVSTYGLPCKYCDHRFCFSHILAEVHGCGDKASKAARAAYKRDMTSHTRGQGLINPSVAGSEAKRKVVANRLADKIKEAQEKRMTDDNAKFISAGGDKSVFLWDVATAKVIRRFARHKGPVNCCDFAGQEQNILITGSNDKTVMLWDWRAFTNNRPLQTLTEAYDSVQAIKVINERYDIRYGRLTVDEFDGQSITCISPSSDSRYLLLGMLDSGIRLFETQTNRVIKNYKGKHVNRTYKTYCTFDGSENLVLTGSEAGSLVWYDVADDDITGAIEVITVEADVCDALAMRKLAELHPDVDLVIANAGVAAHTVSGASAAQPTPPVTESSAKLLSVNVLGVMNTILPYVDPMRQRGRGHLVIMSSMGSYLPTAASPEYHASKACVRVYGESLRVLLRGSGVNVTVICPGFVKTPMTDIAASRRVHPLPLMMSVAAAANYCKEGIDANMAVVNFPNLLLWVTETVMSWPSAIRELIIPRPTGVQASRLSRMSMQR